MISEFAREKTNPDDWRSPGPTSRRRGVPALCLDRLRIECQRALEHFDRLRASVKRRLRVCGASPEDVIQLIHKFLWGWGAAIQKSVLVSFLAFLLIPFSSALAGYSSLFVFGDSLSDSGNNFLMDQQITQVPISGNSFIPTYPYASKAYTNDQVWAQIVASSLGLSANPSLAGGTDYAYGGARTGTTSPEGAPSLEAQVGSFLSQYGPMIPGNALYVVEGGGDNARDGLEDIAQCHDTACIIRSILATAASYAVDIYTIDAELEAAGAKNILVWNVPDLGKTPAVLADGALASILGTTTAFAMNLALLAAIGTDPDVKLFDDFDLLDGVIADPGAFGLSNVTDACAQFPNCDPSEFLFWDGIHPTSAAEAIISNAIDSLVVPEPSTLALLGVALLGLGFMRCGRARSGIAPSALRITLMGSAHSRPSNAVAMRQRRIMTAIRTLWAATR